MSVFCLLVLFVLSFLISHAFLGRHASFTRGEVTMHAVVYPTKLLDTVNVWTLKAFILFYFILQSKRFSR